MIGPAPVTFRLASSSSTKRDVCYLTTIRVPSEVSPGFPHQCRKEYVSSSTFGTKHLIMHGKWLAWRESTNPIGNPLHCSPSTHTKTSASSRPAATPTSAEPRPSISPSTNRLPLRSRLRDFGVPCVSACTSNSKVACAEGMRGSGTRFAFGPPPPRLPG
jgi:hypothetical protein